LAGVIFFTFMYLSAQVHLGADKPRRGEVGPLVAGVELPSAVDDCLLYFKTIGGGVS